MQWRALQLSRLARAPDALRSPLQHPIGHGNSGSCVGRMGRRLLDRTAGLCSRSHCWIFASVTPRRRSCCWHGDPQGIKPLYYTQTPEGFAFASEIRALLGSGVVPKRLSQDAVTSYLLFGSVSEPVTLLEGVFSLPPGHRMLLHVPERRRVPRARPWWDLAVSPAAREPRKPRDLATAAKQLRPLLEDAVRAHLIADVPVGLFLSSGLDSGAIAALAAQARSGIESFTLTFPGTAFDEGELREAGGEPVQDKA